MRLSSIVSKFALFITIAFLLALGKGIYELLVGKISFEVFLEGSFIMIGVIATGLLVVFFTSPEAIRILKTVPKVYKKELSKRKSHS